MSKKNLEQESLLKNSEAYDNSLDKLILEIQTNIQNLRQELRQKVNKILPQIPPPKQIVQGEIFIESVGSIVKFNDKGNFEFLYTADTLPLRDPDLKQAEKSRKLFFETIATTFPPNSRILNIGAGGDTAPIESMEKQGHEILSTDMGQDTVDTLQKRTNSPTFACDLQYLNQVLPPEAVDFIIGNSTLGYLDPEKIDSILPNIIESMRLGGVFTFDLTPHPLYFRLQENKPEQTVVNESDIDPTKIIEFIDKYGVIEGINAMAYYQVNRGVMTNIAIIQLLKEKFEAYGLQADLSSYKINDNHGNIKNILILRVNKNHPPVLEKIYGEEKLNFDDYNLVNLFGERNFWYRLACIDRKNALILAKKIGLKTDSYNAPWDVAHFINDHLCPELLHPQIVLDVLENLSPHNIIEKIKPYWNGTPIPEQKPLSFAVRFDQITHKMLIDGKIPLERAEEFEMRIDFEYAKEAEAQKRKKQKAQEKEEAIKKKQKRKMVKKSRRR